MLRMYPEEFTEKLETFTGICLSCMNEVEGLDPDTRNKQCGVCLRPQLFGIYELIRMGIVIHVKEEAVVKKRRRKKELED